MGDSGGLGRAKPSVARVALAQLETLESAPTPLGAAAAAKSSDKSWRLVCISRVCDLLRAAAAASESARGRATGSGLQLDSEAGQWRNFQLLSLSVSVFERDLEGGNAAELEVGVAATPGLGTRTPQDAFA